MRVGKPRLVFISPVFLFPNDAGGKIRTTNILRGLKGGAFDITLLSVATAAQERDWAHEIGTVCDSFIAWRPAAKLPKWMRALDLLSNLPVNIAADRTRAGIEAVRKIAASGNFDVMVFDFVHSAVLRPPQLDCASVCFTHNTEAEILQRHAQQASNPALRWMWSSQYAKMKRFEGAALRRFTAVVAVSERDAKFFARDYGISAAAAIPTGVDLDFFSWCEPPAMSRDITPTVVFTGSMNWTANIDGIQFFLKEVWPRVLAGCPEARFQVVGRDPPASLISLASTCKHVEFTGFVDDVRPYVHAAHAFVIPLLVGGGTRIKAFEAMAMGCPVVSTTIGIEGLEVAPDDHYLCQDSPAEFASAVLSLLCDAPLRNGLSQRARHRVEDKFGHRVAAQVFEQICLRALEKHRA